MSTQAHCKEPSERARKIESLILQALSRTGSEPVAREIGVSEATVSRLRNEHLRHFAALLAATGLKVVPVEMQCYRFESIAAMLTLAKERMAQLETPQQLAWDD